MIRPAGPDGLAALQLTDREAEMSVFLRLLAVCVYHLVNIGGILTYYRTKVKKKRKKFNKKQSATGRMLEAMENGR